MSDCDAGHGCTISCPNGCGAVYVEPHGPCTTFCSGSGEIGLGGGHGIFTIAISALPCRDFARIFKKVLGEEKSRDLEAVSAPISFKLTSVKVHDVLKAVEKHVHDARGGK